MTASTISLSTCLFFAGCIGNDGFYSPGDTRTLRPLGTFSGKAIAGGDTVAVSRVLKMVEPKIGILWRAIGLRDKLSTSSEGSVTAELPFDFTFQMLQAPPKEVLSSPEIAFGIFCLYSDANANGYFDRLMHPDLPGMYHAVDSLSALEAESRSALLEVSEIRTKTPTSEKFHLDAPGILATSDPGSPDTLWRVPKASGTSFAASFLDAYESVLRNENRWERFFANRKKDNDFYSRAFPVTGHTAGLEVRYDRRLFPKPGKEALFSKHLRSTIAAKIALSAAATAVLGEAFMSGRMEYPFSGFGQTGSDWMAGRTIQDLLLFLPTQEALDTLRQAIPTGSFRIMHPERIRIGYNLFHCDDQYACDVRSQDDSILVCGPNRTVFS